MEVLLLLLVGGLALGLPHSSNKDRRRFWHPWIDNGLAPFILGVLILPLLFQGIDEQAMVNIEKTMRALLIVSLSAAGLLVGMQLRVAYFKSAGWDFLSRETVSAVGQGLLVFIPIVLILLIRTNFLPIEITGTGLILAAFAMACSQRPMKTAIFARHRAVIVGHIVPTGWWNVLALIFGATGYALCAVTEERFLAEAADTWLIWLGVPLVLGISLSRLAVKAHSRDEAYVFLLAIIAICGGVTVARGGSPLLGGILLGVAFVNISLGRSALVERAMEDLEHPVVVATGLFAGLSFYFTSQAHPLELEWSWLWAGMAALVILLRILYRRYRSPSSPQVSKRSERMLASPGATGVLFVGSLVLLPANAQMIQLVHPFILALFVLTVIDEWWGSHSLSQLQKPASQSLS